MSKPDRCRGSAPPCPDLPQLLFALLCPEAEGPRGLGHVVVAEAEGAEGAVGAVVGLAAAAFSGWNRREQVEDLYVAPSARGRGTGRAPMRSVVAYARHAGARCVWLETRNVNYPAVRFYRRLGFRLCGSDERLYDPATPGREEIALFLALDHSA